MVESPANFVGLGASWATKGGRLCTGTADVARNKFFPAAGCPAGREGDRGFETPLREAARTARTRRTRHGVTFLVPTSDLTDEIRSPMLGEVDREIRPRLHGQRGRALRTVARVRDRAAGAIRVSRRSAFLLAPPRSLRP